MTVTIYSKLGCRSRLLFRWGGKKMSRYFQIRAQKPNGNVRRVPHKSPSTRTGKLLLNPCGKISRSLTALISYHRTEVKARHPWSWGTTQNHLGRFESCWISPISKLISGLKHKFVESQVSPLRKMNKSWNESFGHHRSCLFCGLNFRRMPKWSRLWRETDIE